VQAAAVEISHRPCEKAEADDRGQHARDETDP